jgi:hypothetical protein
MLDGFDTDGPGDPHQTQFAPERHRRRDETQPE